MMRNERACFDILFGMPTSVTKHGINKKKKPFDKYAIPSTHLCRLEGKSHELKVQLR